MFARKCLPALLALLVTIICSCTQLRQPPIRGEFEGVGAAIKRKSTVSVFICHGMGGYSEGDPCDLVQGIARGLCLRPTGPVCRRSIVAEDPHKVYGCLARQDYCGTRCPADVRFYILDWSATTRPEKDALLCVDREILGLQVKLIKDLKRDFVNNAMADVALYMGYFGPQMRYPIQQALRWVYEDSRDASSHEMVVVGFSMGGQMILDTFVDMRDPELEANDTLCTEVRQTLIDEISAYFMISNQIPLLQLAETEPFRRRLMYQEAPTCSACCTPAPEPRCVDPNCQDWDETSLGQFIMEKRITDPCFQIVSVSDPDDLLSYPCFNPYIPYQSERALPAFAMAGVREAKYAYFGFFVNPKAAHQNYGENPKVIRMITCGHQCGCPTCRQVVCNPCASAHNAPIKQAHRTQRTHSAAR